MKCLEPGVLKNSDHYFSTPSLLAQRLFFYLISAGHFYCQKGYHVRRKNFNSFLLMLILNGEFTVKVDEIPQQAGKNDIILLNCYQPHEYYTNSEVEFVFLHFDGNVSGDYFDIISKNQGLIFSSKNLIFLKNKFFEILSGFEQENPLSEAIVSCILQQMLCELIYGSTALNFGEDNIIANTMKFISENYKNPLSVEDMARQASMSKFHFSRQFKRQTGYSPYEYLTKCRIDKAKHLLKKTSSPIKDIAFQVGFESESNFIASFHSKTGMSPNKFRKLPF